MPKSPWNGGRYRDIYIATVTVYYVVYILLAFTVYTEICLHPMPLCPCRLFLPFRKDGFGLPSSRLVCARLPTWRTEHIWLFSSIARSTIVASLDKGIKEGLLEIADCDGTTREFGTRSPASESACYREGKLIIKDETFWVRVYLSYDVGCWIPFLRIFRTLTTHHSFRGIHEWRSELTLYERSAECKSACNLINEVADLSTLDLYR